MPEANARILIAEDEPVLRMLMAEVLEDAGYTVEQAANGGEAIRLINNGDRLGLVLTDINMPEADGMEVAQCARARNRHLPVIFMSGRPNFPQLKNTPEPWFYLGKPFKISELVSVVAGLLKPMSCLSGGGCPGGSRP